jgi:hypothetical protein
VNASITFLLKTTLAKTAKEGSSSLSGTTLEVGRLIEFNILGGCDRWIWELCLANVVASCYISCCGTRS